MSFRADTSRGHRATRNVPSRLSSLAQTKARYSEAPCLGSVSELRVEHYTILLLPILHGVWHTQGRFRGRRTLPNSCAIVLQLCGQCRRAEKMKGRLTSAQTTRSKTISCKGQTRTRCPSRWVHPFLTFFISYNSDLGLTLCFHPFASLRRCSLCVRVSSLFCCRVFCCCVRVRVTC